MFYFRTKQCRTDDADVLTDIADMHILSSNQLPESCDEVLMKSSVQDLIQRIVVSTSFFPFSYFYRKVYELSVIVASLLLRRVDGVLAIYLRRGLAKGEIVYGLSDIDLAVIVKDDGVKGQSTKKRVRAIYNNLSRLIPLFGSGDKELGVYSYSELLKLFNDYGFYRYRFNEGKYTWRLLFGEDLVRALPELEDAALYLPATEELKTWWALLNGEISSASSSPLFQRKYLWYKACAEASKIYLFIYHGKNVGSREAALTQVKGYLSLEQSRHIDKVQNYLKKLTSKEDLITDELLAMFITLVSKTFGEMERKVYGDSKRKKAMVRLPSRRELVADDDQDKSIEELEQALTSEFGPYLSSVTLIPQVEFDLDILSNSDIDSFNLALHQKDFMPVEKLKRLCSLVEKHSRPQNIEPFLVVDGNIAFSLQLDRIHNSIKIKSPGACPLFFALFTRSSSQLPVSHAEASADPIMLNLPSAFEETVRKRADRINAIISNKDIYKLQTLDFIKFFWGAARTKLLARSLDANEIYIPITSKQIFEAIIRSSPGDSNWLAAMHGEYLKELRGQASEAYRFTSSSVELLSLV